MCAPPLISSSSTSANPPRERARGSRRQTVGFFLHPNYDARVACLPTCTDADHPPRYAPILAGEHMLAKLERRESHAAR
jgi:isopenicillin N synthase-like dioxygenase